MRAMRQQLAVVLLFTVSLATTVDASKTVIDLVSSDAGFSTLIRELQRTRLIPFLNNRKSCTFFAPTNAAFSQWRAEHGDAPIDRDTLLYHILPDNRESAAFKDAALLETILVRDGYLGDHREGQLVAVAKPSWRPGRRNKILVGDAELLKVDWIADNGVVHVVDRLLVPPKDLVETMRKHSELEALYNIIQGAGLESLLREHRPFTLFAPTVDALRKLNDIQVRYLQHEEGRQDLKITFHHHIHSGTLYKHDIPEGATGVSTVEGQDLMIYRDNRVMVDNAEVEKTDILASNGVIHTVARPLLPSALVWTAGKYLIGMNATSFVGKLRDAGLSHYIDVPEASYTIFAPRDDVADINNWKDGPNAADVLRYHIVPGKRQLTSFQDGQLLATELHTDELNGLAQHSKVSLKQDRKRTTVSINGAEVIGEPVQVGKSIIYLLDKPMELPLPLIKRIKQEPLISKYTQALTNTGLARRLSDAREVTVFAPSTQAWDKLGVVAKYLDMQESSAQKALEDVTRYTVVEGIHYTGDIKSGRSVLKTSEGSNLVIEKNGESIFVGEGRLQRSEQVGGLVTSKDLLVDSGVVHVVSSVALPPTLSISLLNVLQGAGTEKFLKAIQTANITRILTDWDEDFTIFAPTDEAFEKADLQGALNDVDFIARLVRLHVIPGQIIKLEEDIDEESASMLNREARLSIRDIHHDGKAYGVRVKGARSKKEARIIDFGHAHPASSEEEDRQGVDSIYRNLKEQTHTNDLLMSGRVQNTPRPGGVVYVTDRVLLPGDPDPLGAAWFWICVVLLGFLGTTVLCAATAMGVHALITELRELEGREGYAPVPTRDGDEEAAINTVEPGQVPVQAEPESVEPAPEVVVDTAAPAAAAPTATPTADSAAHAVDGDAQAPERAATNE
ncbi:hypothetical protein BGZ94_007278 [Podila epigama]|nr:hypothetical protein BGZ94_007278 [Podila epigama]